MNQWLDPFEDLIQAQLEPPTDPEAQEDPEADREPVEDRDE